MTKTKNDPSLALNDPQKNDDVAIIKRVNIKVDVTNLSGSTTKASINPVRTENTIVITED